MIVSELVIDVDTLRAKFDALRPVLDERARRVWAATEARSLGYGGVSAVSAATGISRPTITAGVREIEAGVEPAAPTASGRPRLRRAGAGRKTRFEEDATLLRDLDALVEPTTRGDPESPLRWTCKSLRVLSDELERRGHSASPSTVGTLLHGMGYSLQSNRKTREGEDHPDRNEQFEHINAATASFQRRGQPVISVDTKKKELVGDFKNAGREWLPAGNPEEVRTHDFIDPALGKAIPYGVYDTKQNEAWVSVGTDHDTPAFAAATILTWWENMGRATYPDATALLITADGGGSNGYRARLWKVSLQRLADTTGLKISVCHFPPGTSKWNKIEHRLFCHITQNWRGRPLESIEAVVELIGSTKTRAGLKVRSGADTRSYETGIKVPDEEMAGLRIRPDKFHGEWNYHFLPRSKSDKM